MASQKPKALKRLAVAFAIALLASGIYLGFLEQHTNEARTRVKLESTQQQLIKTKNDLIQKEATSKEDATKQLRQIDELNKQIKEKDAQLQAKRQANTALAEAVPEAPVQKSAPVAQVTGTKTDWMRAAGIPENVWTYVDYIVSHESGWNPNSVNKGSGACGLGQQLPCGKWAGAWNDPVAALVAMNGYVNKYGGWAGAYAFWTSHNWY